MNDSEKKKYEFDEEGYKRAFEREFESKYKDIEVDLSQKLVIGVMGIVDVGKTSLIKQLLDKKYADFNPEISPIPGTTKDVELYKLEENIIIADTPGLEDVEKNIAKKTLAFIKESDIFLYLFNATIGVNEPEKVAFETVSSKEKPVLVILNKIDAVKKEEHREQLIKHTKSILGTYEIIATCADDGYNVDKVEDWIRNTLQSSGKDLLWAKISKTRDKIVNKWIIGAAASAAAIGALPIPGSDIIPLASLQIGLILKIAHTYGYSISRQKAKVLIISTSTGMVGRTIFRQAAKLIPGYGSLVSAAIAGSFTLALGYTMKQYFKHGMKIPIKELASIGKEYLKEAKKHETEYKEARKRAIEEN